MSTLFFCRARTVVTLCFISILVSAIAFASISKRSQTATAAAANVGRTRARSAALIQPRAGDGVVTPAAGSITVNSLADVANSTDGLCTLREAITAANTDTASGATAGECEAGNGDDTINFSVTGTINLTSVLPDIMTNMSLNGPGADLLTVQRSTAGGTPDFRVFAASVASPGTVTIAGLTITNGHLNANGAGILSYGTGTVNVNNSIVSNNSSTNVGNLAGRGGGIFNFSTGTVNITNSTISANHAAWGGGVENNGGTINITTSTISNNTGNGGVYNGAGTLNITSSTISGNRDRGIFNPGNGTVNFTNSTINLSGDGIYNGIIITGGTGTVIVTNSTINSAPKNSGLVNFGTSPVQVKNSIIAHNGPPIVADLNGRFTSQGHNLIGAIDSLSTGFAIGTNNANGDLVGTTTAPINPLLGALANNGGPTQTMALLPGSLAIDAGDNCVLDNTCSPALGFLLLTDQRDAGFSRVLNGKVDIGAYESPGGFGLTLTSGTPQTTAIGTNFSAPLIVTVSSAFGEPVAGAGVTFTAPLSGASGTFTGNVTTLIVLTNASGVATSPVFKANGIAGGPYNVVASIGAAWPTTSCSLTNTQGETSTLLTASVNPSNFGQNVTFTAKVTSASGIPVGTVQFKFDSASLGAPVALNGSGVGQLTTSSIPAGAYTITAEYSGSPNFIASAGTLSGPQVVRSNPTSTLLTPSVNPSDFGQNVTFTAKVTSAFGIPVGAVQFKFDGASLGAPVALNGSGVGQLTTSSIPAGAYTITAEYSGSPNFIASAGTLSGPQVVKAVPSLSIDDVGTYEGDAGTRTLSFTATLSATTANLPVTVNFATSNGTATAGSAYVANNGTLTFNPGQTTKLIPVTINGDQTFEPDETFFVNLSNPVNATISKAQGTCTILNDDPKGGIISYNLSNYRPGENAGSVTITVNRTGDVAGPATVDYSTDDTGAPAACGTYNGLASSRCDYTTAAGTLQFAPGDTAKTFDVLLSQDNYVEGPETFGLKLTNLTGGAVLGTPSTATVTIDNEVAIDDPSNFARQHYHDFLNREPDGTSLAFWTNEITSCGSDQACIEIKQINVSASFFLSIEFQQTGYLVERLYKAAYGDTIAMSTLNGSHTLPAPIVRLDEFLPDAQEIGLGVIVNQAGWEGVLENNKQAFTLRFVQRSRFTSTYWSAMTPAQFVDTLFANAGVTPSASDRTAAINEFGTATTSINVIARARALRRVAENSTFSQQELNRAFVLMEYFGYLRRNPNDPQDADYTGYDFWLTKMNQFNGNYIDAEMVKALITSSEYRQRFGP